MTNQQAMAVEPAGSAPHACFFETVTASAQAAAVSLPPLRVSDDIGQRYRMPRHLPPLPLIYALRAVHRGRPRQYWRLPDGEVADHVGAPGTNIFIRRVDWHAPDEQSFSHAELSHAFFPPVSREPYPMRLPRTSRRHAQGFFPPIVPALSHAMSRLLRRAISKFFDQNFAPHFRSGNLGVRVRGLAALLAMPRSRPRGCDAEESVRRHLTADR